MKTNVITFFVAIQASLALIFTVPTIGLVRIFILNRKKPSIAKRYPYLICFQIFGLWIFVINRVVRLQT